MAFITRIYHDARSSECQIQLMCPSFQSDFKRKSKVVITFSKYVANKFHKNWLSSLAVACLQQERRLHKAVKRLIFSDYRCKILKEINVCALSSAGPGTTGGVKTIAR
jgi:hypothetical protein